MRRPHLGDVVALTLVAIGVVAIARGVRGAELHPAATADKPPGWQLHRALPGEEFKPVGRFFDARTGCQLDLASDKFAMPSGTRLVCLKIDSNHKVTDR